MYLYERLLGISVYFLALIVISVLILKLKRNYIKRILDLYLITLVTLAYNFIPTPASDLSRLIPIMNVYSNMSQSQFYLALKNSNVPVSLLYYRIIGFFNKPMLLPAVTALIFYYLLFKMIKKEFQKNQISKQSLIFVLFFIFISGVFIEIISGIRSSLSIILVSYAIYREYMEDTPLWRNVALYLAAALMHQMGMILVIVRFLYVSLIGFKNSNTKKSRLILIIVLFGGLIYLYNDKLLNAISKFLFYLTTEEYYYIWEYLIGVLYIALLLHINIVIKRNKDTYLLELNNFSLLINIFIVITIVEYNTFHRLIYFSTITSIPLLFEGWNRSSKVNKNFYITILFIIMILSFSRGNISSFKFLEF